MITVRRKWIIGVAGLLLIQSALADDHSIEVTVRDQRKQPVAGAQVQLDRLDAKAQPKTVISDANGRVLFKTVGAGKYKVSAFKARLAAATAVDANKPTTAVTLSMDPIDRAAGARKQKRYVWVAAETGTHIGGGRWVAVDDDVAGTGANAVDKKSGQMLTQPQSFNLRPWSPPGQ